MGEGKGQWVRVWQAKRISLVFFVFYALLHEQLVLLGHITAALELILDKLQNVKRADWTFGGSLETGLDAGGVEEVEAEEGGDLVWRFDVVVADGTLA